MDLNRSGVITFDEFLSAIQLGVWDVAKLNAVTEAAESQKALQEAERVDDKDEYEWEIPYAELELGKKMGEGTFGIVYRGRWRGTPVAIKMLKSNVTAHVLRDFKAEVGLMGRMRHPNVVLFLGACTMSASQTIVSEFLEGSSLYEMLHEKGRKPDLKLILRLTRQAAYGLNYLHLSGIVHRDLKSANLLLSDHGPNPVAKLCDFGLSCLRPEDGSMFEQVGSPLWMAPELLLKKPYTEKVDIFALAIVVWEMLTCTLPYAGFKYEDLITKVAQQGYRPQLPSSVPKNLGYLMRACWDADPLRRPNCAQVISHLDLLSDPKSN
eukprot:m51a1_g12930 putative protein kinase (323) ;mRNA; r:1695-2941